MTKTRIERPVGSLWERDVQPGDNVDIPAFFNVLVWVAVLVFATIGVVARTFDVNSRPRTQDRRNAPGR